MTFIPTISPITKDLSADGILGNYARCVVTAAALRNSLHAIDHRMASFEINFSTQLKQALHDACRAAEDAKPGTYTLDQVRDDIAQQAFLLLTQDVAEYHNRIKF
jgi:translation initiation factor 2B subunit (eIF-2B alpha/beta/delta family)